MLNYQAPQAANSNPENRQRNALDNLIRRELKVSDPTDPEQIANALVGRYQSDVRAQAISGEAKGLPFLSSPVLPPAPMAAPTATNLDLDQARSDVNQDLGELLRTNLTKDLRPELEGWQQAITAIIDDGVGAARQGLDAYQRDQAFAARRQLGEYARLARLIGALTPELNEDYRNLAQSLDEVCAVLLVLMGESIANAGFAGGRYLLQVPYTELQSRRDAVLVALRNLSGGAQESLNQGTWPRGLDAYRQVYQLLESTGQTELRSLLVESELAGAMDELIHLSSGGSPNGMRMVGATAWSSLNRFERFIQVTLRHISPQSPALTAFQQALQLFVDGFNASGGFRLLRIARPTVLLYGLYGSTSLTHADRRLIELVGRRGQLASKIDCLTRCQCELPLVLGQTVLDKLLFDIDRAIDLYAIGSDDLGTPETRAAAYGILINAVTDPDKWTSKTHVAPIPTTLDFLKPLRDDPDLNAQLQAIRALLLPSEANPGWDDASIARFNGFLRNRHAQARRANEPLERIVRGELALQYKTDRAWQPLVQQMTPGCVDIEKVFAEPILTAADAAALRDSADLLVDRKFGCLMLIQRAALWTSDADADDDLDPLRLPVPRIPRDLESSFDDFVNRYSRANNPRVAGP